MYGKEVEILMLELDVEIEVKPACMLLSYHVRVSERTYTL